MAEPNGKDRGGDDGEKRQIVPLQVALLEDVGGRTLQDRFTEFLEDATSALMASHADSGEPLYEAGKAKATLSIKIDVSRVADDSIAFAVDNQLAVKLPKPPGKGRTSQLVTGIGLAQPVRAKQLPMFAKDDGQPRPLTIDEATNGRRPG